MDCPPVQLSGAPESCTGGQSIKTNAAGVYGYSFPTTLLSSGGFSVAILGETVLDPGSWDEADRPSFLVEVLEGM